MDLSDFDIRRDKLFKEFVRARDVKETTENMYVRRMKFFCSFVGLRPKQLIEEAESEIKNQNIRPRDRKIKSYLLNFIEFQRKKGKSDGAIGDILTTVKGFYRYYDILVPNIKNPTKNNKRKTIDEIITKDHIKAAIKVCKPRDRAIILLQLSSGLRASEVRNLKYKDLLIALNEYLDIDEKDRLNIPKVVRKIKKLKNPIGTWRIDQIKSSKSIITFSTPESIMAIADYLLKREIDNRPIKEENDSLFVSDKNNNISENGYSYLFQRINDRADFGRDSDGKHFLTSHKLRKYFSSILYKNGLPQLTIDWMLGHSVDKVTESYFAADIPSLKNEYMGLIEELSVENVETSFLTTPAYDSVIEKLNERDKEIKEMKTLYSNIITEKTLEIENLNNKFSEEFQILNNRLDYFVDTISILTDHVNDSPELDRALKKSAEKYHH